MNYKVCVLCMTYNHHSFIKDTLDGFCMQKTDFPYVCCIVDDYSTDGEQRVLSEYLQQNGLFLNNCDVCKSETDDYEFSFVKHKTNSNCFIAVFFLKYNHWGKKSKLEYVEEFCNISEYTAICDGDDYWISPDKLKLQADLLDNNPSISLVCTRYENLIEKTKYKYLEKNYYFDNKDAKDSDFFVFTRRDAFLKGWITKTLTCMYRSDLFDVNYINSFNYSRDVHIVNHLLMRGKGACLALVSGVCRLNESSSFNGKTFEEQHLQNYNVFNELFAKTHDPIFAFYAMGHYSELYKKRVPPYHIPRTLLQFFSLLFYIPLVYIIKQIKKWKDHWYL